MGVNAFGVEDIGPDGQEGQPWNTMFAWLTPRTHSPSLSACHASCAPRQNRTTRLKLCHQEVDTPLRWNRRRNQRQYLRLRSSHSSVCLLGELRGCFGPNRPPNTTTDIPRNMPKPNRPKRRETTTLGVRPMFQPKPMPKPAITLNKKQSLSIHCNG